MALLAFGGFANKIEIFLEFTPELEANVTKTKQVY
jgi:hypothetical protein